MTTVDHQAYVYDPVMDGPMISHWHFVDDPYTALCGARLLGIPRSANSVNPRCEICNHLNKMLNDRGM